MAASLDRNPIFRHGLAICAAICVITTLAPARFIAWINPVGELATNLIAPASRPALALSRWLRPPDRIETDADDLKQQAETSEHWRTLYLRELARNTELRERIRSLQSGAALAPEVPVKLVTVPVLAAASDPTSRILRVRAGSRDGVVPGTAAAVGPQLIGRTLDAGRATSQLRVLTDPAGTTIRARVFRPGASEGFLCELTPRGDDLQGPLQALGSTDDQPQPGDEVRLDDPNWRRSAQLLLIGRIERIDRNPEQPLRLIITVAPTLELSRVSEVVLRIPQQPEDGDTP